LCVKPLAKRRFFYGAKVHKASLGRLDENAHYQKLVELARAEATPIVAICASLEAQIAELDPAERPEFLKSVGLDEPGLHAVIRTGYELLGLITYLTAGPKE